MSAFKIEYRDGAEGFVKFCEESVCVSVTPPGELAPQWVLLGDLPDEKHPVTGRSYKDMWRSHKQIARECLVMENGVFIYTLIILCWMRGDGKCERKGSELIMFDGSVKKVEDVKVGDLLMGDDNTPRTVLTLDSGIEEMFEVVPMRGESKFVTANHVLSLKRRRICRNKRGKPYNDERAGEIVDITLKDYVKQNKCFKDHHLLYRVPLDFPEQKVLIDPYFLGLWLADGSAHLPHITTMDKEVIDCIYSYANELDLSVTVQTKPNNKASTYCMVGERLGVKGSNILLNLLREYDLIKNKHIPQEYKANSRDLRMSLLAGLVDGDGSVNRNSIEIIIKCKVLADDVAFLARSLGFHVHIRRVTKTIKSSGFSGKYYRLGISGDCSVIPTRIPGKTCRPRSKWKDVLVTGIKEVKSIGDDEYYGFQLDGNGRYVTGDFTVTHNSFLVCLIFIWKWLCFPKQQLVLCANSKDQSTFVHYSEIRKILENSPNLLKIVGESNIQQKELRLRDGKGNIVSTIFSATTFTGILSNIGGYTFSEFFDLKNHKFFEEIDTSTRNITNAFGLIDTTVSSKQHPLFHLYTSWLKGEEGTEGIYFSYRCSPLGKQEDFWHPNMTQKQLDGFRVKHHIGNGFNRFFKNVWEAAEGKVFSPEEIEAIYNLGVNGQLGCQKEMMELLKKKNEVIAAEKKMQASGFDKTKGNMVISTRNTIRDIESSLWPVDSVYKLSDGRAQSRQCSVEELCKLGDLYDTDWAIMIGMDRAGEGGLDKRTKARTIITAIAKGLPQSRTRPEVGTLEAPEYIYILLNLSYVPSSKIADIKAVINDIEDEYNGIDTYFSETWAAGDLRDFCEDKDIYFEIKQPTLGLQKAMFIEMYLAVESGRFKSAKVVVEGSDSDDIFVEEMGMFEHDPDKKSFGSPQKASKNGVQDDVVFAIALTMHGGRFLTIDDFEKRVGESFFGAFYEDKGNVGIY